MTFKLGKSVEVGNKILVGRSWHKITTKFDDRVVTNKGNEVKFGDIINGWRLK